MAAATSVLPVVKALCPTFVFHERERWHPCTIAEVEAGALRTSAGTVSPIYYVHNEAERSVTYILTYLRDGGAMGCVGGHAWDVEFVRVFYIQSNSNDDAATPDYVPVRAYFSAHSSDQGTWVEYADQPSQPTRHLTAYVALSSHAFYPKPGRVWRIFGFGNDLCSKDGFKWADAATSGALTPMPDPAALDAAKWDSFMQWAYATSSLRGAPSRAATWYRLFYPLTRKALA